MPVLFYLAGLTCTEETFMIKAGAQRVAAELGVMLVAPDTSPRGANVPGEDESWDLGTGAGFYLDATMPAWSRHYRMDSYVTRELHAIATGGELPGDAGRAGIFGHSMGGHGALVLALRNPSTARSRPSRRSPRQPLPLGQEGVRRLSGDDVQAWAAYDASALMARLRQPFPGGILVDQGQADQFLAEQLYPEVFEAACAQAGQPLTLRRHEGYDHGYYFISTFIEDHIRFHVEQLGKPAA